MPEFDSLRVLAEQGGVGVGHELTVTMTADQITDETLIVLPCGSTSGNPFWDMGAVISITDSKGGLWSLAEVDLWNVGTIRTDFGAGGSKGNILFGPSGRRTSGALLEVGDTIVIEWFDAGTTLDGTAAVVLGVIGGLTALETELGEGPQYVGLARSQGNDSLLYASEAWVPVAYLDSQPEGFAICISVGQSAAPDLVQGDELGGVDAGTFVMRAWAILNLIDGEIFEPGSGTDLPLTMVNFQFGSSAFGTGSPAAVSGELQRFGESGPWRFLVTDLDGVTQALLDRLATNREVVYTLNQACRMSGSLPSDNPEVNLLGDDGYPIVAEGVRLLYCFRRENDVASSDAPIWVVRAAGIILSVEDRGGPTVPLTDFVAFDPWQLLYRRPLRTDDGSLPLPGGAMFSGPGSEIIEQILAFSELDDGPTHLDLLTGVIETTETVIITFQQGISVGEAIDQLVDTGTLDVIIEPVYDPINYPGIVGTLNIFNTAGSVRRSAIFAWDKPSRNLVDLNRQIDGRERANTLQYYQGQGGAAVPLVEDATSIAAFGEYWEQQFFPATENADVIESFANLQRRFRKDGLITYSISPAPERSPVPITDYYIGDWVPVYASDRLRQSVTTLKRVYSIPLAIGDDQMEAPAGVIIADDEQPE